jgi:mRNA interferase RelE/StbE
MYDLLYAEQFVKELKKLEKDLQKRIISALERIRVRPYPHVKKIVGCPYFRLRTGDYRIILDIQENKMIIYALEVGHRKNIYQ